MTHNETHIQNNETRLAALRTRREIEGAPVASIDRKIESLVNRINDLGKQ